MERGGCAARWGRDTPREEGERPSSWRVVAAIDAAGEEVAGGDLDSAAPFPVERF